MDYKIMLLIGNVAKFLKKLLWFAFFGMVFLSIGLHKKDMRSSSLNHKIDELIYDEAWKDSEYGKQLFLAVDVRYSRLFFDEEDISKIIKKRLNYHNKQVAVRASCRRNGIYVDDNEIWDRKLRAVFMHDFTINGETNSWVVFISDNVDTKTTRELEAKGLVIPLEKF